MEGEGDRADCRKSKVQIAKGVLMFSVLSLNSCLMHKWMCGMSLSPVLSRAVETLDSAVAIECLGSGSCRYGGGFVGGMNTSLVGLLAEDWDG